MNLQFRHGLLQHSFRLLGGGSHNRRSFNLSELGSLGCSRTPLIDHSNQFTCAVVRKLPSPPSHFFEQHPLFLTRSTPLHGASVKFNFFSVRNLPANRLG